MTPREKRKEKTLKQILKITSQIIRKEGVEKLSLRQVAIRRLNPFFHSDFLFHTIIVTSEW